MKSDIHRATESIERRLGRHTFEVVRGAAATFVLRVAGTGLAFAFNVVLARYLGAHQTGVFYLGVTVLVVAMVVGRLGLDNAIVRFTSIADASGDRPAIAGVYRRSMVLALAASIIAAVAMWMAAAPLADVVFGEPSLEPVIRIFAGAVVPMSLLLHHAAALRGLKRVGWSALVQPNQGGPLVPALALGGLLIAGSGVGVQQAALVYLAAGVLVTAGAFGIWRIISPPTALRGETAGIVDRETSGAAAGTRESAADTGRAGAGTGEAEVDTGRPDAAIGAAASATHWATANSDGARAVERSESAPAPAPTSTQSAGYTDLLRSGMPLFGVAVASLVSGWIPVVLLGVFHSAAEVGVFSIAFRTAALTAFVLTAVSSIAAPMFAALYAERRRDELRDVVVSSTRLLAFASLPIVIVFLAAPGFVLGFFGEEFRSEGTAALRILALGQFVNVTTGSVNHLLMMAGREAVLRNIMVAGAAGTLALGLVLIPSWGVTGAAVATTIVLASVNLYQVYAAHAQLGINPLRWRRRCT